MSIFLTTLVCAALSVSNAVRERSEVPVEDTWDLTALYPSYDAWNEALEQINDDCFNELNAYEGTFQEGPEKVKEYLEREAKICIELERLYLYAYLYKAQDLANPEAQEGMSKIASLHHRFAQETAWATPEMLALPSDILDAIGEDKSLRQLMVRRKNAKPHTLPKNEAEIVALAGKNMHVPFETFQVLSDKDLQFDEVEDGEGHLQPVTQSLYRGYSAGSDRVLRRNAFNEIASKFNQFENTFCSLLNGVVQAHIFRAKTHHYGSAIESALSPDQVDPSVYHNLIETTHRHLDKLHAYVDLRKELMGIDSVHKYDLFAPMAQSENRLYTFDEAVDLTIDATRLFGPEYTQALEKGLKQDRWVDRYPNLNKRSGAFQFSCKGTRPYMMLNFQGTPRDVKTLAHEAGHAMHSYLTNSTQPYYDSDYTIFVAETASTVHEELVFRHAFAKANDPEERIALLENRLNDMMATFFAQVLFAEFEHEMHAMAERGEPLTPKALRKLFGDLNQSYFGTSFTMDEVGKGSFMQIPHFYLNYYAYQYATGISAAVSLVDIIMDEGPERYLEMLKSGQSDFSVNLLRRAGVDMNTPDPVVTFINRFGELTELLKTEISACAKS